MPADTRLTAHFFLSQLTVSPHAGRSGMRNQPLGAQFENLRRLAQSLEVVRSLLNGCDLHILRAFRHGPIQSIGGDEPSVEGRSAEFIAPAFGSPRDVCAHLVGHDLVFDRLVCAGDWVQIDIPRFGQAPRGQVQTGVFEHGHPMRFLEGLL